LAELLAKGDLLRRAVSARVAVRYLGVPSAGRVLVHGDDADVLQQHVGDLCTSPPPIGGG
jgi:hypothetical protein